MGKPYSQDLRVRVLAAIDSGMSKMAVHTTFRISRSTINDWLALRAAQGHVRPRVPVQRGPQPTIADLDAFKAFAQRHRGCTLAQMAQAWQQETGRRLRRNTFSLALRKIGWTRTTSALPMPRGMRSNGKPCSGSCARSSRITACMWMKRVWTTPYVIPTAGASATPAAQRSG